MKTKFKSKLLGVLLVLVMVLALVPVSALTAFAAEPTEITEIKSVISAEHVPKAGMEVDIFMPNVPDGEPYSRPWNGAEWYDSNGVKIAPTVNHHYDLGYEFEAGHTYYADYQYTASDGYVFAQNPTITLTGPDPSMFTYEIIDRWDNNESVTVRYTFTIPGEFENADINKVSMMYYGLPKDGGKKPDRCNVIYNNCTITSEEWNTGTWGSDANWGVYTEDGSNAPTFLAGNTYVHMIELTAKDGYKFSAGLHVQKGTQDAEEYGVVTLSDDRTVATVKFTYEIPSIEIINTIELVAANQHMNFCLRSGESIYLPQPFVPKYVFSADCPYEVENVNSCDWINDETGKYLELGYPQTFENAKKYTLRFHVRIKDEFETTHKFASGTDLGLNVTDYAYANSNFVDFKVSGGGTTATVEVTFTVQFPEGAGSSAGNPAFCYSYEEFKYAMESPNIRFVVLGNVDDVITKVEGDGLIPAISVNGIKNLNVIGNATFTAPASGDGYNTVCALLHCEQGSTLNLSGAGKLTFKAVTNASYNAVVWNQGGSVYVNGATLIGSYNTAVYGKAIWQSYGELRVSDGQFFAENALEPGKLPAAHTAVYIDGGQAWISGGTFKTESHIDTIDLHYGLDIGQYATVDLSGGTFYGILLPKSSTPLANYMDEELYTPLSDGSRFNPESEYSQNYTASGKVVRIAWLIDHVDVHINAPIAGVDISENYFNIPTSGCKVTMYYPQWYKNGESVTYGTFEAGASYKVVVWVDAKADYGAEFSNGVTVAINNQSVAVDRKSSHLIAVEYDFGECPNIVPEVDLTVTAPKEGNTPSYTIGCGSNAYYAVGSSNYTDYRKWYVSYDGDEWFEMDPSLTFTAGRYYKFVVDIRTNNGYEFPLIDNGTIQPNVTATVNGYSANVIKAYDQDPSRYITVEYNFGECSDSIVERITVENVTEPVAGQKPDYNWSIRGTGYQMNTSKNAYEDIYWKNPPEQWYYIKNGIGWFDVTDFDWVYENETFIAGHEYEVRVYVITEDGFEFAHNNYYDPTVTVTVNGNTAEAIVNGSDCVFSQQIEYTFTCGAKTVDQVAITDLEDPVGGNTPDTEVTVGDSDSYTVESVEWFDIEDNPAAETFEAGVPYYALITVAPATGAVFADAETIEVTVNGSELGSVEIKDGKLLIYVIIRKPASAPIVVPYMFTTQPVGNTVKVDENVDVNWQITFNATKTEIQQWNGSAWVVFNDTVQTLNGAGQYLFTSDTAKSIRLRIVAYVGEDAVATSNEFVIVWEEDAQDVTYYYYPGEASGSADFDTVASGTQITLANCMFEAPEGKHFKAWAIGSVNGEQKQPGDKITITAETYIYAIWEENPSFMVSYNSNGGSGTMVGDMITENGTFTLEACTYTAPEGKRFKAWAIGSVNGEQKQPNEQIIITAETYIYAIWEDIPSFMVSYNSNGGSGTMVGDMITENGTFTLEACTYTAPEGKRFKAWAIGSVNGEQKQPNEQIIITAETYIYAIWEDITYTVSFNANGGAGSMLDETEQLGGYVLPECTFTAPTGKQFKCWAEGSASGTQYNIGDEYDVTANVTFYAVWENIPVTNYTINATAGANGTISPSGEVTVAEGEDKTFTITANSGYHIKDVKVNGSSVGTAATYTFNDVAANATITVEFEVDTVSHVCNPTLVPEDEPDCTTAGKSAYYHCECGKNYEDAEKQKEIENIETWGILNALGHEPSTAWSTDGEYHWKECVRCAGQQLEKAAHTDSNNDGKCDVCEYQMSTTPDNPNNTPDNPNEDKDGLGTGAIVGIVIGSVAVAGIGGFALFWFVIKKKSFADLIAVFKKK